MDRTEAARFLNALWTEDGPQQGLVTLWTLPDKRVRQLSWSEQIAAVGVEMAEAEQDVYVTVASMAEVRAGRGSAKDAKLLPALALDLDVSNGDDKGKRRFVSTAEALDFAAGLPLPPSMVVSSGGGLHVYWLLREPEPAMGAARIWSGWLRWVQGEARVIGVDVDSVADLARILRLPGTVNRKYDPPRAVAILSLEDSIRYALSDFEPFQPADGVRPVVGGSRVGNLILSASAQPPLAKLEALLEADPKFKATWLRKRKDLRDQSPSGYDMSIASICVAAGWTDQEIADAMIYARVKAGVDLKLREDYYQRTIDAARSSMRRDEILSEISATGGATTSGEEGRAQVFEFFSVQTGARIVSIQRSYPVGDLYIFTFENGRQLHVTLKQLTSWREFWHVLSAAGYQPFTQQPKAPQWLGLVNALSGIAEPLEVEVSREGAMLAFLIRRVARSSMVDLEEPRDSSASERAQAIRECGAFYWDGLLWVRLSGLLAQAEQARYQTSAAALRAQLTILGAERRLINAKDADGEQRGGTCYGISLRALREVSDVRETGAPGAPGSPLAADLDEVGGEVQG